jgi:hypothetical protein
MQLETARLVRQRFGIVRIAAGAFDDLAALDLPNARFALRNLRRAEAHVSEIAEALRDEAFAAIRGCADVELRRRLLRAKRDLFNGRRVDASLPLPSMRAYAIAIDELDAARVHFERAFDDDVAAARTKLHALANSEALQRPLARASLALLAEIRRGVTRRVEAGLMKYVTRMHVKSSPFSTFCHVAVARFDVGQALSLSGQAESLSYTMTARLGEARVTVRDDQFEDSVLEGDVSRAISRSPIRRSRSAGSCGANSMASLSRSCISNRKPIRPSNAGRPHSRPVCKRQTAQSSSIVNMLITPLPSCRSYGESSRARLPPSCNSPRTARC